MKLIRWKLFFVLIPFFVANATLADTFWINPASGLWRTPENWSGSILPDNLTGAQITNSSTKSVLIDALTPGTNLTVSRLLLSAPLGFTNTLDVTDLTTNIFQSLFTVSISRGGALVMTNSTMFVDPNLGGAFNIIAGSATVESGLLDCGQVTLRVGRTNNAPGFLTVNGGNAIADTLLVGATAGSQGILQINGGTVTAASLLSLGETTGSTGTVSVSGGQLFVTNGFFKVGNLGVGHLTISNGLVQCFSEVHLADTANSTGIVSIVGGQLIATNDITAIGRHGFGQMTVSNASVTLTNVSVGRHPSSRGTLVIQSNSVVTLADDLSIGRFNGANGTVLVTGGLLSIPNDIIWVGREGSGQMTISNGNVRAQYLRVAISNASSGTLNIAGGTTLISSNFVVGNPLVSTGQVFMTGGNLIVTNTASLAALDIQSDSFSMSGGTIATDKLLLTNSAGQFSFNEGIIQTESTTINNGAPFVVGDGTNVATLELVGGTHSFANGLIISSNAVVTGCGTIVGTVINNGQLLTCNPVITSIVKTGSTTSVSFTTLSGKSYNLQYKNSLNDATWTTLVPSVSGTGNIVTVDDPSATVPTRIYQVRLN